MSQAIKVLPSISFPYFTKYGIIRHLCFGKDLTKPSLSLGPDFLLQNLKNAPSPKSVLKLVNEHYNILNSKHLMQALRSLFDLQKYGSSDVATKDILRHPDFERLCKKLRSQSGIIELNETIEALKIISYVGVPSNSTIVQVLLQLIRQNINSLTLPHIMFLDFLLHQFRSSPLVEALKIALPIVFEIHLPMKMDKENVTHLADYLQYASRARLREGTVDTIVKALYQLNEEFDAKTAKSIIWSISDMETNEIFEPLMNKAISDLIIHIDNLTYTDIESTLTRLTHKYTRRCPYFYNEIFSDTCANYIIDHDLGFEQGVFMLRKLGRMNHVNKYLLDYVSKKVFGNPSLITNADSAIIYSIVIAASLTNYRPIHWDNLKDLIMKKKNLAADNRREILWIRFAASLCLLDIYKIDVLSKALNPQYLESLFKKGFRGNNYQWLNYFWAGYHIFSLLDISRDILLSSSYWVLMILNYCGNRNCGTQFKRCDWPKISNNDFLPITLFKMSSGIPVFRIMRTYQQKLFCEHGYYFLGFMSDYENYFAIWQSIKLNRSEFIDILPSKYEPENVVLSMKEVSDFPLEASLQNGIGGEQYVMSNLVSKKGHQIDHAILFRKGGYPVAINNREEVKFIEDIEVLADNELLLILALQPIQYTINTKVLREATSLLIRILELDGYSVLPINLEVWESLSEFEKIPYLMQHIKNKVENDVSVSESKSVV